MSADYSQPSYHRKPLYSDFYDVIDYSYMHLQAMYIYFVLGSLNYASSSESAVATQSSSYGNNQEFSARNANDGNFGAISTLLAHTWQRSNEWLKINLMQYLYVTDIVIYNRIDCCGKLYCNA